MKNIQLVLISLFLLLIACKPNHKNVGLLNPNILNSQYVSINTAADTEFVLQNGSIISIPKGAIKGKNVIVKLELKEAITMEQIVSAGLNTQSNGRILSSGGMLYINVVKGEEASIIQPIKIKVPTNKVQKGMKLFKGEETDSGINWTNPQEIAFSKDTQLEIGAALFQNNCSSCHNPLEDATGPALYGTKERWGEEGGQEAMYNFIRNSSRLISSDGYYGQYARCVYDNWGKTAMICFPNLSDADIDAIYKYVYTEARARLGKDTMKFLKFTFDSCQTKSARLRNLENDLYRLSTKRKALLTINNVPDTKAIITPQAISDSIKYVTPNLVMSEYYNIQINTFGWHNIDIFIEEMNGVQQSELFVRLIGSSDSKMQILLIIPEYKVMVQAGLLDDGMSYGFKETNGKLPLMQGVKAYILVLGEDSKRGQLQFGITSFTTSISQKIEVNITPTDSASLRLLIDNLQLRDTKIEMQNDSLQPRRASLKQQIIELRKELDEGCKCYNSSNGIYEETSIDRDSLDF